MKRRAWLKNTRRTAAGGFSLVELLTVIAIIVLLIGILVPAVNAVRIKAKVTATRAMISAVTTALETYRADRQLGGAYPPSASDMMMSNRLVYQVSSPHSNVTGLRNIDISGAGLLVFALAGADLLGCPGFKTFRSGTTYWGWDTDDRSDGPDDTGAYGLDEDTLEPVHPRVSPFVDLTKVGVTKWNPNAQVSVAGAGSFELPMEDEATEARGEQPFRRPYPMFLDDFGGPLLYWRADPAGVRVADRSPTDGGATGPNRGIYHFADNEDLLDATRHPLQLTSGNADHRLIFDYDAPLIPSEIGLNDSARADNFAAYIRNKSIEAKVTPQRADSYLVISAGPDGVFGSADDIANFDHNGAELLAP